MIIALKIAFGGGGGWSLIMMHGNIEYKARDKPRLLCAPYCMCLKRTLVISVLFPVHAHKIVGNNCLYFHSKLFHFRFAASTCLCLFKHLASAKQVGRA